MTPGGSRVPALVAHRLGRAYGPDSSRAALERTLAGPVDGVETDLCLTADDDFVLVHDPLLTLGTTLEGWAHERAAAEIRAGRLRDRHGEPTGEPPLLLGEALDAVPRELPLQLDVKAHADRRLARRAALTLCERLRREPRRELEVISFHSEVCAIAAARGFRARLVVWADYAPETLAAWAVRRGIHGVSVEHFLLTDGLMRVLRLAGLSVNTGTVNSAELLAAIAPLLPDAVCTDRPHELHVALGTGHAAPAPIARAMAAGA
jgi:glycerophosphoryl diester phosphodiesterase